MEEERIGGRAKEGFKRKGKRRRRGQREITNPESSQVCQPREICPHISMARISIATTANYHDYKAGPTTSMSVEAGKIERGRENETRGPAWPTCGARDDARRPIGLY